MSVTLLEQKRLIAKKEYYCNLSDQLDAIGSLTEPWKYLDTPFTEEEKAIITKYAEDKWRIKPGTPYIRQKCVYEGDFYTWRAREDIYNIFKKYDLFYEE